MKTKFLVVTAAGLILLTEGATAQMPTSSNFVFPSGMGNSGVFRIPTEAGELQVQVELLAEGESRFSGRRCDPVWTVRDPSVLALVKSDPHYGAWVKPVRDGITELRASFSCAPKLNLSVPVVVGAAAIDRPFAATGEARNYYPATLELRPPGSLSIEGGRAIIGLDQTSVQFIATSHNPSGSLINADQFPMKWTVSNPGVLAIEKAYDHTAFFNPVGTGTTTVTASIEGISQSFDVTVQKDAAAGGEAGALATRITRRPAVTQVLSARTAETGTAAPVSSQRIDSTQTLAPQRAARNTGTTPTSTTRATTTTPISRIGGGLDDGPTSGPPPVDLKVVSSGPKFHTLSWTLSHPRASFDLYKKETLTWELIRQVPGSYVAYYDTTFVAPGTRYRVVANYSDGRRGSADITFTNPMQPQPPVGFAGKQVSTGTVQLEWTNSHTHRVFGPGLPADGALSEQRTMKVSGLPVGTHSFSSVVVYGGLYEREAAANVSVVVRPTSGTYRVVFLGVKAVHETADDPLQFDGKRDEIFAAAYWATVPFYHGPPSASGIVKTMTYGDTYNIPNRIQAGSASNRGGIRTGDAVGYGNSASPGVTAHADRFPLLIWEGTLADSSDALVIAPTVWEWDGNSSNYTSWTNWWSVPNGRGGVMDAASNARRKSGIAPILLSYTEESSGFSFAPRADVTQGRDRPIGVRRVSTDVSSAWWMPFGPVVTREKLEAALGTSQAVTVMIKASDALYLDGQYELYIQFERR